MPFQKSKEILGMVFSKRLVDIVGILESAGWNY